MKRNDFLKKLIKIILAFIMWGFLGLLIFLRFANVGHCASSNINGLPYIVTNENTTGWNDFITCFYRNNSYSFAYQNIINDNYFGYDFFEYGYHYFAFYFPSDDFTYNITLSNDYEDFDMTNDSMEISFTNFTFIKGYIEYYAPRDVYYFYGGYSSSKVTTQTNVRFFVGTNKGDGNMLVPNLASENYVYDDDIYKVVFGFGNPTPPWGGTGHSTGNMVGNTPDYQGSNLSQYHHVPPTYTINNYTWTTPQTPPFDDTDVLSAIESLKDIVVYWFGYLTQNLSASFNNLISNIGGFIVFIGDTIGYWAELLRENIVNGINALIDNISGLFDPIAQNIAYILQPVDFDKIKDEFQSTYIYTDISTINSSFTSFKAVFDNTSEPNSYVIPLNLQNIPILHSDVQYIDLGDFLPVRPLIRTFAWVITTFSIFFTVIDSLPNYINGGGNE